MVDNYFVNSCEICGAKLLKLNFYPMSGCGRRRFGWLRKFRKSKDNFDLKSMGVVYKVFNGCLIKF